MLVLLLSMASPLSPTVPAETEAPASRGCTVTGAKDERTQQCTTTTVTTFRDKKSLLDETMATSQDAEPSSSSCCVNTWLRKNKKALLVSGSVVGAVALGVSVWWFTYKKPLRRE